EALRSRSDRRAKRALRASRSFDSPKWHGTCKCRCGSKTTNVRGIGMAQSSRKRSSAKSGASRTKKKKTRSASTRARGNGAANGDAIALLKADHREVEGWFEDFEKARSDDRKQELAKKICTAL